MTSLQRQFNGFLNTHFLWEGCSVFGLQQFDNHINYDFKFQLKLENKLRLGKLVERFVSEVIKNEETVQILAENIQIQDDKKLQLVN